MANTTHRPTGRRVQAGVFRVVNIPMRALLALPFPTPMSKRLMLVHHIGRKTGKHYRQPVSYVSDGDTLLTPGGGRWTANLRDGAPVRISLRGRRVTATPVLVRDPDDVRQLLGIMAERNPALNRFVRIPTGPDGALDRRHLALAIEHGFRVVRWQLAPAVENSATTVSHARRRVGQANARSRHRAGRRPRQPSAGNAWTSRPASSRARADAV